jgi:DNA repair protein RecN (Recombination protein N)
MLALKTSLAAQDEVPILVFDEIDANVGGEIAHAVASKMLEIGGLRQVLCITHLPQVAAAANAHFVVRKSVVDGRTVSSLDAAEGNQREQELARMLGDRSGRAALAHARELLEKSPVLP